MSYLSDIEFIMNNIYFDIDFSDEIATKEHFSYLVDNLNRDNIISDRTSQNIYLSMNKKTKNAFIVCGSYKIRI